jgi:hypothetical protein
MTQQDRCRIEALVMEGRETGLSDEAMADEMQDATDALTEGPS